MNLSAGNKLHISPKNEKGGTVKNIVLTGFMGTGKSTVGRALAQRLGLAFVDTDVEIERITGKTIYDLFQKYGAIRFYSEEALVVKKISAREGVVIATGGSTIQNNENLRLLRKNGVIVLISSTPEVIYNRVKSSRHRPMLERSADLRQQINNLIAEREDVYRDAADFEVISGENGREEVVGQIVYFLRERKYI